MGVLKLIRSLFGRGASRPTPAVCSLCGADWARGAFTPACVECDGGAMDRPCLACSGACGGRSQRAVHDSRDEQVGVWLIRCKLGPPQSPA